MKVLFLLLLLSGCAWLNEPAFPNNNGAGPPTPNPFDNTHVLIIRRQPGDY